MGIHVQDGTAEIGTLWYVPLVLGARTHARTQPNAPPISPKTWRGIHMAGYCQPVGGSPEVCRQAVDGDQCCLDPKLTGVSDAHMLFLLRT